MGTHGRAGTILKTKPTVRAHLRNQKQWYTEFLSLCPGELAVAVNVVED